MKKLSLLVLVSFMYATTITGTGYGNTKKDSQKEALSDLSSEISVDVKSHFKSYQKLIGKEYQKESEKLIDTFSNLPIKGAKFYFSNDDESVKTTAILDSKIALKLYMDELKKLQKEIAFLDLKLETTKDKNLKYNVLKLILKNIDSFEKNRVVARLLGAKNLPSLNITKSEILVQLKAFQTKSPTLEIASDTLTKGITEDKIYINPIKPSGSEEVTQLAKILKEKMATHLNSVRYPKQANYILRGKYEILKDSIFITINLYDMNNNIIKTNTAILEKSAYENISYKPKTKTFDRAMNSGFVKSGKLSVNIGFRGYERENGIDLKNGDEVDIVVKTNKPICYYLIGYTLKNREKFAYLLPIGSDDSPFINYITGDDVNKNIIIADNVPIEAPFGRETLQIFASTLNKDASCPLKVPKCEYNENDYCVIKLAPSKVISKARGLNLAHRRVKIEKAENSINWTSFK